MSPFGVTHMIKLCSHLIISRHGIYYFRYRHNKLDQRVSLRTREPRTAELLANQLNATLTNMKNQNVKPTLAFDLEISGDTIKLKTEDNDADRAAGMQALLSAIAASQKNNSPAAAAPIANTPPVQLKMHESIKLETAILRYTSVLSGRVEAGEIVEKSKLAALAALKKLQVALGSQREMWELKNDVLEDEFLEPAKEAIKKKGGSDNTLKKELSFIRGFFAWASERKQRYLPEKFDLSVRRVKDKSYIKFDSNDLQNIFENLPKQAEKNWEFWIPVIGLFTGGRISEIAKLKTDHFTNQTGIETIHLPGSKTDAAPRDVPIHAGLVSIGLLNLVQERRKQGKKMLFELPDGGANGAGGHASNYFTEFKRSIGITHEKKVFHSFRHTVNDLMRQALMNESAKLTYIGHSLGTSVNVKSYSKTQLAVPILKSEITDKMDWQKYCGWCPDIENLKKKAAQLLKT